MSADLELDTRPEALGDLAEVLRRAAEDLGDVLAALAAESTHLTGSWTGEAADAYRAAHAAFARDARVQVAVLDGAGKALAALARSYATTDEQGARTVPH